MVKALLSVGAYPTLRSCPSDDIYEDATKAAETSFKKTKSANRSWEGVKEKFEEVLVNIQNTLGRTECSQTGLEKLKNLKDRISVQL